MRLESVMSIAPHSDDQVICEDTGESAQRINCYESVDGKYWADIEY